MKLFFFCLFAAFPIYSFGQDYNSIVSIKKTDALGREFRGTGVVIGVKEDKGSTGKLGFVATANHVIREHTTLVVEYFNGRKGKDCQIVAQDESLDLAILLVWIPPDVFPVELASELERGDEVVLVGRPFDEISVDKGQVCVFDKGFVFANAGLVKGDSGGPVFLGDKLVGINVGVWFFPEGKKRGWPAMFSGPKRLNELYESVK